MITFEPATPSNNDGLLPSDTVDYKHQPLQDNVVYVFMDGGWIRANALYEYRSTGTIAIGYNIKSGDIDGFTGLVKGDLYYINEGGGMTNDTSNFQAGSVVRLLGQAKDDNTLMFVEDSTFIVL